MLSGTTHDIQCQCGAAWESSTRASYAVTDRRRCAYCLAEGHVFPFCRARYACKPSMQLAPGPRLHHHPIHFDLSVVERRAAQHNLERIRREHARVRARLKQGLGSHCAGCRFSLQDRKQVFSHYIGFVRGLNPQAQQWHDAALDMGSVGHAPRACSAAGPRRCSYGVGSQQCGCLRKKRAQSPRSRRSCPLGGRI